MKATRDRREILQAGLALPALARIAAATTAAATTAAAASAAPSDPLMAPGIALALAQRRATQISGLGYDITLDLTGKDRASGSVRTRFTRKAGSGDLILDFRGPHLAEITVNGRALAQPVISNGHILIPQALLRTGRNTLSARFESAIAAAGAPIIRFQDSSDNQTYLYTLLVPSDANLLFPCFDQPDLKARFRWRLTAPEGWSVLANGKLTARRKFRRTIRWIFAETMPISTYLAAFAAGPWTIWTSAPSGEQPISLYARTSRRDEVDAAVQLEANRTAVTALAEWFGVPFPFAKLDLLLAPAFPFGGMEHVGAVFYNENRFIFREPPTLPRKLGRDQTIYHEISHQWFGDAVTMRWFDDLWLKEGFSTFMAARIQAELQPQSNAWSTFLLSVKQSAYRADATSGTQPLWQRLENLDAAKTNYGPIVYNKAPAVIKQLAFFVGEDGFKRGLTLFLTRHAYANAGWQDLLGAVSEASGVDLAAFGQNYILRAGMPQIETELQLGGDRIASLALTQRPVRALPDDRGGHWPMKVRVRLGYTDQPDVILDARFNGARTMVPAATGLPAPAYVWANDDDQGYGLFLPDARTIEWIIANIGGVEDNLLRAMLWSALWDVVRDARFAPADYIAAVLRVLPTETDEQISRIILSRAAFALTRYLPEAASAPLRPGWEAALIARTDDATLGYGLRKDALDRLIDTARTPRARTRLEALLANTATFDNAPIRQPTRWAIITRLIAIDAEGAAALFAAEQQRDQSTEAVKDAFVARAATPVAAIKQAYFTQYFDDPTLNEAWASESLDALNTPEQAMLTLPLLRPALDRLEWIRENRRIFFLPAWIEAFIGGQQSPEALQIVDRFLADRPDLPLDIRRKVLLTRDELERTITIRRLSRPQIPPQPH